MAAVALEQFKTADAADHLADIAVGDRRDAEADIFENLDMNSTEAKADQGSERRVLGDANHEFNATSDHGLNQHPVEVFEPICFDQPSANHGKGLTHGSLVLQVELHAA